MYTIVILLFFKLSFVLLHDSDNDNCPYSDARNKYTEGSNRWQQYFDSIEKAEKEFRLSVDNQSNGPCSSCHDNVRENDLAPFSGGITKSMMEKAESVSRVTKYQIINGKLNRYPMKSNIPNILHLYHVTLGLKSVCSRFAAPE